MINSYNLLHCYRDGIASVDGMLDDYSFYSKSLIDLYETTLDPDYLLDSFKVCEKMIFYFGIMMMDYFSLQRKEKVI